MSEREVVSCHSNVEFDDICRSYDRDQPESKRYKHCSASILFNKKMPLSSGHQSLPLVGNRVIVCQGPLRMLTLAISNITYLPYPNYNTRVLGNSEEIVLEINDAGALCALKNAGGKHVPPPSHKAKKVINVNIESENDAPIIGRRIALECNEKYAGLKMNCPLGANDQTTKAKNLQRIQSWSQVRRTIGTSVY